jgi:hypothetical protein
LPRLVAKLEDNLARLQRVTHELRLGQGTGESLLTVDVFSGSHRMPYHLAMPMIWRGDHHGIDVRVGEQIPVVRVSLYLRVTAAVDALLPMRSIHIADRRHLEVGRANDRVNKVAPAGS